MTYDKLVTAEMKAAELSRCNHCTFSVYHTADGKYDLVNGVDTSRTSKLAVQYMSGKLYFIPNHKPS